MPTIIETREQRVAAILAKIAWYVELQITGDLKTEEMAQERKAYIDSKMPPYASTLAGYSDGVIRELYDVVSATSPIADDVAGLLYSGESQSFLQECIRFSPLMKETPTFWRRVSAIRPLHSYTQLTASDNYATCDSDLTAQAEALCIVIDALNGFQERHRMNPEAHSWVPLKLVSREGLPSHYDRVTMLSNNEIVSLIVHNPKHARTIAETMIQRRTTDADLIRSIITNDAPSISSGML